MKRLLTPIKIIKEQSPKGRMARGVLANIYDKGAITFVQLLTIPLLTGVWGADGYGVWLMLLTVPTYIALSDLGFGTAAGVVLIQCISEGKADRANTVLHSTIAFVMGTVMIAAILAFSFAIWFSLNADVTGPFPREEVALAIVLITCYALVLTQMNIVTVVYRATHKYAFAMIFSGTWILLEGFSLVFLSSHGFGLVHAALAFFLIRLAGYIIFIAILKAKEPWVHVGVCLAQRETIRCLANPSAASMGLTLATAASLQGMVLALGITGGPAVVAIFGAARTLSRAPDRKSVV